MIRASSVHRICTHRLEDNTLQLSSSLQVLKEKVEKKGIEFNLENLNSYLTTQGLMTAAKDYASDLEKQLAWEKDDLPVGAKTYMKELWLQENYNFVEFSLNEEAYSLKKGKLVEDEAIELIGQHYGIYIIKNEETKDKGFVSGTCDVIYKRDWGNVIRDTKCPISWNTFKNKNGITSDYYWQLIAYCYLYDANEAYLDYVFMPTPKEILDSVKDKITDEDYESHLIMNENINQLSLARRIKTYKLNADIKSEIDFMLSRVEKCQHYYNTLDYEKCMNVKTEDY